APNNKDYEIFLEWLNTDIISIIAKTPFYIALNKRECWNCSQLTPVITPATNNYYALYSYYENREKISLNSFHRDQISFFSYLTYINKESQKLILEKFPFFKYTYSNFAKFKYWANHCENCNILQGDWFLHNEPGGAFQPLTKEEWDKIEFIKIS